MFLPGVRRYNKRAPQFAPILDAIQKKGAFVDRSLERDIIRSTATISRNGKWVYIKLTAGQAAYLSANIIPVTNKTFSDEKPED